MTTMNETDRPSGLHPMWSSHQERATAIADLADQIAGTDPQGETYLEKAGRLNEAQREAEAQILNAEHEFDQKNPDPQD